MLTGEQVAQRVAREIPQGSRVELGEGVPAEVRAALPEGVEVVADGGDVAVFSAAQVSMRGELSGAGARSTRAKHVIMVGSHTTDSGAARIVESGSEAGQARAQRIITELAVIDVQAEGLVLREVAPGLSALDVQEKTDASLLASSDMCLLKV